MDWIVGKDIKRQEKFISTYEINRDALNSYKFFRAESLPSFQDLPITIIQIDKVHYTYFEKDKNFIGKVFEIRRTSDIRRPFFQNLEKPIRVENEYNTYHLEYLNDNVRRSEDFGNDNHIYLHYDSMKDFLVFLHVEDISSFLSQEKFIFSFGEDNEYPLDIKKEYGIVYKNITSPIKVEEIHRIIVSLGYVACAGNVFMSGVLDYHTNLLTLKVFGMSDFTILFKLYFSGKSIGEFEQDFLQKNMDDLVYRSINDIFIENWRGNKLNAPSPEEFFVKLKEIFPSSYIPNRVEWIKAIFLAYSNALGRVFRSRIVPAIKFETHWNVMFPGESVWRYNYSFFYEFKYCKMFIPMRRMIVSQASMASKWLSDPKRNFIAWMVNALFTEYAMQKMFAKQDERRGVLSKILRFEDLKLYTKAALVALCEYLDIPWDDMMLKTTGNGYDYSAFGTKDFDPAPVYKRYYEICNPFDYYRLEIVMSKFWKNFGYEPLFYKENIIYSTEEILKMFELPFQCEKYHVTEEQKKQNETARKQLYSWVKKRLSEGNVPLDNNGKEMIPIPWIIPKPELMERDLYR